MKVVAHAAFALAFAGVSVTLSARQAEAAEPSAIRVSTDRRVGEATYIDTTCARAFEYAVSDSALFRAANAPDVVAAQASCRFPVTDPRFVTHCLADPRWHETPELDFFVTVHSGGSDRWIVRARARSSRLQDDVWRGTGTWEHTSGVAAASLGCGEMASEFLEWVAEVDAARSRAGTDTWPWLPLEDAPAPQSSVLTVDALASIRIADFRPRLDGSTVGFDLYGRTYTVEYDGVRIFDYRPRLGVPDAALATPIPDVQLNTALRDLRPNLGRRPYSPAASGRLLIPSPQPQ